MATFEAAEAVIAPIYSIADIFRDPHFLARDLITKVMHPKLGEVRMQNAVPRFSETPGAIRSLGGEIGEHNHEIFCGELGHSEGEVAQWQLTDVAPGPGAGEEIYPLSADGNH